MAALDIPFSHNIASPMASRDDASIASSASTYDHPSVASGPATYAAFSPATLSANTPSRSAHRSTVLVHQKSPLLLATPPQVTRALAYSHPFLLPLNTFVGLLTWSTGDPWQSFLLVCSFWLTVLYGDVLILRAGPVVVGAGIIIGMYGRRYSPLSSSSWSGSSSSSSSKKKTSTNKPSMQSSSSASSVKTDSASDYQPGHKRTTSEITKTKHQKTLDEIVETLKEFTARCNALLDPLLVMTDFLSTQRTATSATTKPALIAMFMRLLIVTPFWFILTMSPLHIITTRRVVLVIGTIILTWHARVMRVTRTILWRSSILRRTASAVTGLRFDYPVKNAAALQMHDAKINGKGHRRNTSKSAGVKFTFIIYENQRRWLGLGWTHSLFAYERAAWSDEHNNAVPPKDEFELPHVEDGSQMKWDWAEGSRWRVDGVPDDHGPVDYESDEARNGWIYYDNKWQYGRRGEDGWGRWTRRRKWYRDAELVEADDDDQASLKSTHEPTIPEIVENGAPIADDAASIKTVDDAASTYSTSSRFWPGIRRRQNQSTGGAGAEKDKSREKRLSMNESIADDMSGLGLDLEMELQRQGKDGGQWGIGDEARMNLE